ncbi:MAG: hypothetical protein FWG10_11545 [Eubacteriaceae bacterium]|nr:hypothetical protein [Eubacteriaceae bacterium]
MFCAKGADGGHCPTTFRNGRMFTAILENGVKNYMNPDERSAFEKALDELAMSERIINGRSPGPVDAGNWLKKH